MSNRKLLSEIERTLKKVVEGIGEFEVYLDKLNNANTSSQKERWEGELKKEIKKLQRFRDQIKTWQLSNEIKDKEPLNESRRSIEVLMEKFKTLEKDLKIKAYSKEGLIAASKMDPKEKEKLEVANWITNVVDKLKTQVDAFEAELEASFSAVVSKKSLSSSKKGEKPARQFQLEHLVERNKFHIDRLEKLLRMMENEDIHCEDINDIKDRVEYYLESNESPDFDEDESIYDDFDFDTKVEEIKVSEETEKEPPKPEAVPIYTKTEPLADISAVVPSNPLPPAAVPSKKWQPKYSKVSAHKPSVEHHSTTSSQNMSPLATAVIEPIKVWSNMPRSVISADPNKKTTIAEEKTPSAGKMEHHSLQHALLTSSSTTLPSQSIASLHSSLIPSEAVEEWQEKLKVYNLPKERPTDSSFYSHSSLVELESFVFGYYDKIPEAKMLSEVAERMTPTHVTHPSTTDKATLSQSSNPFFFPTYKPTIFDQPSFYEKLEIDTLFTIFYYQPNTYAQYLAARELKRQSWRFHKKYLTWFQRHEEPKIITEDYEQGTYIYFDYEGSWCQRKKSEFTFEYRFLEDAELV